MKPFTIIGGGDSMLLGRKRKLGRKISEITVGEKLTLSEKIEDKDLLLYLGLTDDANPLYIQHDYAAQTSYKKPLAPTIMLTGIISSAISKYLPGPGSHIHKQDIDFLKPVYHYGIIHLLFEVVDVNAEMNMIQLSVKGTNEEEEVVIQGLMQVSPPERLGGMVGKALENF